jgi:hypothetical protein
VSTSRRDWLIGAGALAAGGALASGEADAYARRRYAQPEPKPQTPVKQPNGPVQIVVSLREQKLWVYDKDGLLETSTVSSGTGGYPTPTGVFAILEKSVRHFSNIYGGAPMPYMQRLTMSGVALHQGVVTGRPASHGCVRLPAAFAPHLYQLTKIGARVIVMHGDAKPVDIAHPALFVAKPLPVVKPEDMSDASEKAKAVAAAVAKDHEAAVMLARIGSITAWRREELRKLPVSVFVSRAEGRMYVRHGFSPLFDVPVTVADPDKRIGTHVYTAVEAKGEAGEMRWSVVTHDNEGAPPVIEPQVTSRRGRAARAPVPAPIVTGALQGPASTASEALDRLTLPDEARARVSDMLSVGASLIVSDEAPSHEMRVSGTDFVVLVR